MNTRLMIKLSAVAVALIVNGLILGGAAYVVKTQSNEQTNDSTVGCAEVRMVHLRV
jgi:hypothetical protein